MVTSARRFLRVQTTRNDLYTALEHLSTLKITSSDPEFRKWVWEVASDNLECLRRVESGEESDREEQILDVADHNNRVLEAFYHATPQKGRTLGQQVQTISSSHQQSQVELARVLSKFQPITGWRKWWNLFIEKVVFVIIGSVATYAIIKFFLNG